MKTLRFTLVKTAVAGLLIGLSNAALARPSVYIGVGIGGRPGFHGDYRPAYRWGSCRTPYHYRYCEPGWGRRHYYPHRRTIILGGGYWYDWGPDYYVAAPPTVIERTPVIVERQTVIVQPQGFDESTLQLNMSLQYKKSELLKQLQTGNKELRMEAIKELAGFSFDDKVRQALENVLLSDPDAELRKEAARTFGKVKNKKALAALEKARVEDSNEDVRKEADQTIKTLEGS